MSGSNVGAKAICAVVDTNGTVLPCIATDNGNDTCTLKIDGEFTATIDPALLATAANQTALSTKVGEVQATPTSNTVLGRLKDLLTGVILASGTNFIGRVGNQSFKVLQSFTRPSDGNAYIALDAMTNSTSTPTIMSQDLSSFGATAGRFLVITNARVISSVKGSGLSCNIWAFPTTFTATNDNAELSIDDTTAALGGVVIPCNTFYSTALNSRCVSDPGYWKMQLGAASTTIYFCLQASAGYTPASGEVFTVVMEGHLE